MDDDRKIHGENPERRRESLAREFVERMKAGREADKQRRIALSKQFDEQRNLPKGVRAAERGR